MSATRTSADTDRESAGPATNSNEATSFEIDRQSGANINNIGGDQTIYYGDRSRANRIGKIVAALGLFLSLVGFAVLVLLGAMVAHRLMHAAGGIHAPYGQYIPSFWPAPAGLLVAGFVFRRFARIMVGR